MRYEQVVLGGVRRFCQVFFFYRPQAACARWAVATVLGLEPALNGSEGSTVAFALPGNLVDRVLPVPGCDDHISLCQPAVVFGIVAAGHVAVQHQRHARVGGRDPHAVVAPRKVQVRGVGQPALTGGMPDLLAGLHELAGRHALAGFDVHVQDRPAGLFQAVAVQVFHHGPVFGAHDQPRGRGGDPGVALAAAVGLAGRGKVDGGPGRA